MEINLKEMKTVKEWAKLAGLKLYNYDGFVEIYLKLSAKKSDDLYAHQMIRSRYAGDLLCTRRGFESRLYECTMDIPEISSFEKMSDILPDFVESQINLNISALYGYFKKLEIGDIHQRENIEKLLKLIKLKTVVREKSIKINYITEKNNISILRKEDYSESQYKLIKIFNTFKMNKGTIEDLELYLTNKIIKNLEVILKGNNTKITDDLLDKIYILSSILYNAARRENSKDIMEEFMHIDFPHDEEDFVQPYNIIDSNGIREGKLFRYKVGNTVVKGSIPILSNPNDEETKQNGKKR